jgi:hypothetical protein
MFNVSGKDSVYICHHTFPTTEYHRGKPFMLQPILLPEIEVGMALQRDIRNWWAVLTSLNTMHTLAVTYFTVTVGALIHPPPPVTAIVNLKPYMWYILCLPLWC